MPEENDKSKKDKDKTTKRAPWTPDETQMLHFQEGVKSSEKKEKEKSQDEKSSE